MAVDRAVALPGPAPRSPAVEVVLAAGLATGQFLDVMWLVLAALVVGLGIDVVAVWLRHTSG